MMSCQQNQDHYSSNIIVAARELGKRELLTQTRQHVHRGFIQLLKLWLNLCSFRWFNPNQSLVINLRGSHRQLKLVSSIFIKFLFFHQTIALQKLWKMLFISSKKLVSFSIKIFNFLYFCPTLFFYLLAIALEDDWR